MAKVLKLKELEGSDTVEGIQNTVKFWSLMILLAMASTVLFGFVYKVSTLYDNVRTENIENVE